MSFLVRGVLAIALASAACTVSKVDESAASESNLDQAPAGPLAPDPAFASGGTLVLEGTSNALALGARKDGSLALVRNRTTGDAREVVVSLVKPDGSATTDVVLPGIDRLATARLLAQGDALVLIGGVPAQSPDGAGARYFAARIGADGALDASFMPDPLDVFPIDTAVDASGRILIGGSLAHSKAVIVRLTASGALDTTFAGGQGAWIDEREGTSAAMHLALSDKGAISFAAIHDDGPAAIRLSADGALDASFGKGGRVALPKNAQNQDAMFGLVATTGGGLRYFGPTQDSLDVHTFAIAPNGAVTPGAKLDGTLFDAKSQVSAVTIDDACTFHVAAATTALSAAECKLGVPYVALGEGKRAIAITTPAKGGATTVSVRVFAR